MPRAGEYIQIVSDNELIELIDREAKKAGLPRARFLNLFLKQHLSRQISLEGRIKALEDTLSIILQAQSPENWLDTDDLNRKPEVRDFLAKGKQFRTAMDVFEDLIDATKKKGPLTEEDKNLMKITEESLHKYLFPQLASLARTFLEIEPSMEGRAEKEKALAQLDRIIHEGQGGVAEKLSARPDSKSSTDDLAMIPLLDVKLAAGAGAVEEGEKVLEELAFKRAWIKTKLKANVADLRILQVKKDSMEPTLYDGDLVMIDLSKRTIRHDQIYALREGEERIVKRLCMKGEGLVEICSDNPHYKRRIVRAADVEIIGKVVWVAGRRT